MVDINVHGVLHGMKAVLPGFVDRGRGHLVNVASTAGKGGYAGGATYCGTKHFVVGVSEAVRAEVRGTGVEVSCVMPVVVQTELAAGLPQTRGVKQVTPEDVADGDRQRAEGAALRRLRAAARSGRSTRRSACCRAPAASSWRAR